jgi:hypothetical protein
VRWGTVNFGRSKVVTDIDRKDQMPGERPASLWASCCRVPKLADLSPIGLTERTNARRKARVALGKLLQSTEVG